VKSPTIFAITFGLAVAAASANASTEPRHLEPAAPRTVTVSEADAPPAIRAGLLQSTLIMLPAEEKVANVFAGDTVNWVFDGGHVASRFISVKPKVANTTTDIHIVSDHGNEYTLQLREVSSDADSHFDSKVSTLGRVRRTIRENHFNILELSFSFFNGQRTTQRSQSIRTTTAFQ